MLHTMEILSISALLLCAVAVAAAIIGGFAVKCKHGWCKKEH